MSSYKAETVGTKKGGPSDAKTTYGKMPDKKPAKPDLKADKK